MYGAVRVTIMAVSSYNVEQLTNRKVIMKAATQQQTCDS